MCQIFDLGRKYCIFKLGRWVGGGESKYYIVVQLIIECISCLLLNHQTIIMGEVMRQIMC